MMAFGSDQLLALAIAISFAAGLNLYAVLATLGLLAQADVIALPPAIAVVENWWVIGISLVLFGIEFVVDKVPFLDVAWNALQLFVRVPAGALLAFAATAELPAGWQAAAAVGGGTLSLAAASGKLALRSAATTSPEPFSNLLLSLTEDLAAIGLTWFATAYPLLAAAIALTLFLSVILVASWVWRGVKRMLARPSVPAGGGH